MEDGRGLLSKWQICGNDTAKYTKVIMEQCNRNVTGKLP